MEIKRLSHCTLKEMVKAWNRGFTGYTVPIEMNETAFLHRFVSEDLSPEHSIVAFINNEPVGIIVNGFRIINGKKIVWDGGTGLAPEYRGKGIIKKMMNETLAIYEHQSVDIAMLEAIKENTVAIHLYNNYGYEIVGDLVFLSGNISAGNPFQYKAYRPEQLPYVSFYEEPAVWQCQSHSVKQGEVYVFEQDGEIFGYTVFRRIWDEQGKLVRIILYQLKLVANVPLNYISRMLATMAEGAVPVMAVNFIKESCETQYLMNNGFVITTEQVLMRKIMK